MKPDITDFSSPENTMRVSSPGWLYQTGLRLLNKNVPTMKRLLCIAVCGMLAATASAQEEPHHHLPHIDTAVNIEAMLQNGQVDTPVNVMPKSTALANPALTKAVPFDTTKIKQDQVPQKSYDDRWFISPGLRSQVQDYSMKKDDHNFNDASSMPFGKKTNASFAVSVYRNLSKRISISGDVGLSFGKVVNTTSTVSKTESKTYNVVGGYLYYHLLEDKNKLQPFLSAGIYTLAGEAAYTSAPLGGGIKYHGNGMMATAQVSYAYSISNGTGGTNANPLMYSIGIYLPVKAKRKPMKKEQEDMMAKKDEKKEDSTAVAAAKKGMLGNGMPNINIFIMMPPFDMSKNKKGRGNGGADGGGSDDGNDDGSGGRDIRRQTRNGDPNNPFNYPPLTKFTVYFNYDLYSLTSSAFGVLDEVTYQLKQNSNLYVDLLGYTDLIGSEEYNQPLSKKRAEVAFEYLKSRGIPADRMFVNYFGKENPVVHTDDPNASWRNRRTEIVLYEKK